MVIFKPADLLLKPKVILYDNIAGSGKCKGRLKVEMEIFPSPRISWDFESLGSRACEPNNTDWLVDEPFIGEKFSLEKPRIANRGWGTPLEQPRVHLNGLSPQAIVGNKKFTGHSFSFYLPNVRFQEENLVGQGLIAENLTATFGEENWTIPQGSAGRFIRIPIDNDWQIHLETRQDALKWLKRDQRNIGTYITTIGQLSLQKKNNISTPKKTITLDDAIHRLRSFCLLLSFANGGHTAPLYLEGYRKYGTRHLVSGTFLAMRITPLEQLGTTWIMIDSDLAGFLKCFPAFERMEKLTHWQEDFDLLLAWYLQAIQPQNLQSNKPLPVVANAIGAALERLCVLILVKDLGIRGVGGLENRIQRTLEIVGIKDKPCADSNHIKDFVDIRNDATHSLSTSNVSDDRRNHILEVGIQWFEEILLWRLGYEGKYRDRSKSYSASIEPRFDLSARNPNW